MVKTRLYIRLKYRFNKEIRLTAKNCSFFAVLLIFSFPALCQSTLGIKPGINLSKIYSFRPQSKRHTHMYPNYAVSLIYMEQTDTKNFMGLELENKAVKLKLRGYDHVVHASTSYYNDMYFLNYLSLYFVCERTLLSGKRFGLSGSFSPYFAYLLASRSEHYGLNNAVTVSRPIKDISKINFGIRLAVNATVPLWDKLSLLLTNAYCFGTITPLIDILLTGGLVYKLDRNYLDLKPKKL